MIEALTLRGLEDGIRAKIMIEALTLRGLEDGIRAKIVMEALTLRGLEDRDTNMPEYGKSESGKLETD